jgi:acetyl-CoA carboxylase beta subunit
LAFEERARALLDPGSVDLERSAGSILFVRGKLAQRPVHLALTDRRRAGGALGARESDELRDLLVHARPDRRAVVLVLESAGARLDEGLASLGAFRRLFAAVLDTRLTGIELIGVVHGDCFGGASLVTFACQQQIGVAAARIGLSGPAIIAASGAVDREAVRRLVGVEQRHVWQVLPRICDDDVGALRDGLVALLAGQAPALDLRDRHQRLHQRLIRAGLAPAMPPERWIGFVEGQPVGARACWLAAEWLLEHQPRDALDILLDTPGHATTALEEMLGLSEFVAHLALCLMHIKTQGTHLRLKITGQASGAIYVALAAPATTVLAQANARVRVLPPEAVARVLRTALPAEDLERARECGVIDEIVAA